MIAVLIIVFFAPLMLAPPVPILALSPNCLAALTVILLFSRVLAMTLG